MKRTTSMTIMDEDLDDMELSDPNRDSVMKMVEETALPSWYNHKRSSGAHNMVIEMGPPFGRTCGLCNCGLRPSRDDIFMYRGNMAFCSPECRDQQMKYDERKEKCSIEDYPMEDINHHQATTLQRPLPPQPPCFKSKN